MAIRRLNAIEKTNEIYFWGRIEGIERDYTILMKTDFDKEKFFPKIEFFWSFDCLNFSKLPTVSKCSQKKLKQINDYFIGQHDKNLFENTQTEEEGIILYKLIFQI